MIPYLELTRPLVDAEMQAHVALRLIPGEQVTDCWKSVLKPSRALGYYMLNYRNKVEYLHRIIYRMWFGEIPKRLVVDHLCNQRTCVNPLHLTLTTRALNVMRAPNANATKWRNRCKRGHPRAPYVKCKLCRYIREGRQVA